MLFLCPGLVRVSGLLGDAQIRNSSSPIFTFEAHCFYSSSRNLKYSNVLLWWSPFPPVQAGLCGLLFLGGTSSWFLQTKDLKPILISSNQSLSLSVRDHFGKPPIIAMLPLVPPIMSKRFPFPQLFSLRTVSLSAFALNQGALWCPRRNRLLSFLNFWQSTFDPLQLMLGLCWLS